MVAQGGIEPTAICCDAANHQTFHRGIFEMPNTRKAKYVQDIEEVIELIRYRVRGNPEYFESREERTRYGLIDPMLRALGWDLSGPAQVKVEYDPFADKRDGKRMLPDYALFVEGQDGNQMQVVVVEAKVIASSDINHFMKKPPRPEWGLRDFDEDNYNQLKGYIRGMRTGYGVLTNGSYWDIYSLTPPRARFKKKDRPTYFSILTNRISDCVEQLRMLHRSNLRRLQ